MKSTNSYLITTVLALVICTVYSDTNKDREFINILKPIPCIRRFNTTHQIGCSNSDIGDYEGIVYAVRDDTEFQRLYSINNIKSKKIIVVTVPQYFESVVSFYLNNTAQTAINGIVLIATSNQTYPDQYSDDAQKPNFNFGLYSKRTTFDPASWNLGGTFNMFQSFNIPMYVITDESEAERPFKDCYDKFNKQIFQRADEQGNKFQLYSTDLFCGMQLGIEMSGSISSTVCIRRSAIQHTLDANYFCDPLGGSNYFSFLSQKPSNNLPITIISSRLDTFTLYEYYTPAANEPISSIIGLLSLAELLSKHRNDIVKSNIMFVLFDNEAFDFGGSSRFVNDLNLDKFPAFYINNSNKSDGVDAFKLKKDNITTMIELGQLGSISLNDKNNLYIHLDQVIFNKTNPAYQAQINEIIANLKQNSTITNVRDINQELPPSSLHSFFRLNLTIGGILITDHETTFKNPFYHSIFDTPENMNIFFPENITELEAANYTTNFSRRLQSAVTSIAKSIYFSNTDKNELKGEADLSTLNRLVYCFYKNTTCDYFKSILTYNQWQSYLTLLNSVQPKKKLSFYTSVNDAKISGKWIAQMLLKYYTRNSLFEQLNSTDCNKNSATARKLIKENNLTIESFHFVNNSTCVATTLYQVSSVSPAFDKYDEGLLVDTDRFSAWTESSWNSKNVQMRLFMFTADSVGISTVLIGIATLILSFVVTYVVNKYSNKWFALKNPEQTAEIIEQ